MEETHKRRCGTCGAEIQSRHLGSVKIGGSDVAIGYCERCKKYSAVSDRCILRRLAGCWPMFGKCVSLSRLMRNGWLANLFFDSSMPYIWRSNRKIGEKRFWEVFLAVFSSLNEPQGLILFHECHGGWKRCAKVRNGILAANLSVIVGFMQKNAFYSRRDWEYEMSSDNYNMLLPENRIMVTFTHEGEMLCFSQNVVVLKRIAATFRRHRIQCNIVLGGASGSYRLKSLKAALTAKAKSVNLELKRRDVEHLLFHRERAELITRFPTFVNTL